MVNIHRIFSFQFLLLSFVHVNLIKHVIVTNTFKKKHVINVGINTNNHQIVLLIRYTKCEILQNFLK